MPSALSTPTDEHAAEVEKQNEIAAQVVETTAVTTDAPGAEPTPEIEAETAPTAKIKSVNVDAYPIHVSVVGGEYTFADSGTTFEVPLAVAEQFTYIPVVEVVE
jgi:hypothetical protein